MITVSQHKKSLAWYAEELRLIDTQFPTEGDLGAVMNAIFLQLYSHDEVSVRDVSRTYGKNEKKEQEQEDPVPYYAFFKSLHGTPDIAFLNPQFHYSEIQGIKKKKTEADKRKILKSQEDNLFGCVELKALQNYIIPYKLDEQDDTDAQPIDQENEEEQKLVDDEKQLKAHLKIYKNVIFTNGVIWRFYEKGSYADTIMLCTDDEDTFFEHDYIEWLGNWRESYDENSFSQSSWRKLIRKMKAFPNSWKQKTENPST